MSMTGVILAGGNNSRIQTNKALLLIHGKPIIEILVTRLQAVFNRIIIVTNTPELYQQFDVTLVQDIFRQKGPLGGVHAALTASETPYNFVVACDMPFIRCDFIRYMTGRAEGYDAVIPCGAGIQPLHAVYSRRCLPVIERCLAEGKLTIQALLAGVSVNYLAPGIIRMFDPSCHMFFNINRQDDYQAALRLAASLYPEGRNMYAEA